ncbi:ATP-binding cassette domain-containing protein [Stakelama pacifica]|uniref:ABC-2 type transport system ATP-binding protein/manganese transport system ATP-binding protein n=1 Tax=Stakelama pacifica TaxID=517720 RepID=A0A4R6FIR4_9SPHN|nr:ABC transporter ATP-binding protein [Stakelama pacifica]TDN80730.1 ABC-2 type transport system ATP-binding protein/manganese transport system ATP-binding protein [Stakelama pacifica]GGO97310.1 hypothetical protein GCM10011329_25860 [Stakelama pacifica]
MTPAVDLRGASVLRAGNVAVDNVDLMVAPGTWCGIIGANGSGKTSLLRALAGRLPFQKGSCRIDGEERISDRAGRARHFGFAPPPEMLPDALRVRDILALVAGDVDCALQSVGPLCDVLGISDLLSRWIGDCSAGMRQRVAVASAFADGKPAIILDEPFNWLDPVALFDLREELRRRVTQGLTLITALHDLPSIATMCHGAIMMADGEVAMALDSDTLRAGAADTKRFERHTIEALRSKRS